MTNQSDEDRVSQSKDVEHVWRDLHTQETKYDWSEEAKKLRLQRIEQFLGWELSHIPQTNFESVKLQGNIENFIGSVEVPIGFAGPLLIHGDHISGPVIAPLATSEGALVASASRGAKLLNLCGGVHTKFISERMTRAPSFTCRNLAQAQRLSTWVISHMEEIKKEIKEEYAQLVSIEPIIHGRSLTLQFSYKTGNAAGQNMTTIATWDCCQWIANNAKDADVQILRYAIESGFSGDKKMSHANFTAGRGSRVLAEAWISEDALNKVMHINSHNVLKTYLQDIPNYFLNGSVSCNANTANIVAALFTATGQDIACVHESSLGQLAFEMDEQGLYVSLLMPCLVVGTIGGGTSLPCQKEALKMLDCQGENSKERLAQIISGFCLALELSTFSSSVEGSFVGAHSRLGRKHP
ncbi:MAG: hydroxymethylglutaryl-CoA reductase [Oligoflexus sp.]